MQQDNLFTIIDRFYYILLNAIAAHEKALDRPDSVVVSQKIALQNIDNIYKSNAYNINIRPMRDEAEDSITKAVANHPLFNEWRENLGESIPQITGAQSRTAQQDYTPKTTTSSGQKRVVTSYMNEIFDSYSGHIYEDEEGNQKLAEKAVIEIAGNIMSSGKLQDKKEEIKRRLGNGEEIVSLIWDSAPGDIRKRLDDWLESAD